MSTSKSRHVKSLAIKLHGASEKAKLKHAPHIWGGGPVRKWKDLPSESVDVWEAVADHAYKLLR